MRIKPAEATLSRHIIIAAGILILVILGSAVYIHHRNSGSSENPSTSSAMEPSSQGENLGVANNADATSPDALGEDLQPETSSVDKATAVLDYSNETTETSSIEHMQRAFAGEISIVEAFRKAASEEGWGYDGLVKNLGLWTALCSAPESELSQYDGLKDDGNQTTSERIKIFCMDYPSDKEMSEYGLVHMDETTQGVNDWSRRLNSPTELGPEAALRSAIVDLSDALYAGNYAEIAEIIWFLGLSKILGLSNLLEKELNVDESISIMFSDAKVMLAVSASIYCARLGGCSGTHPVTLGLCFQLSDRPCHNPGNLHHAAEQILTGRELMAFYQMHQGILSLVSRHRRGDF